MPDYLVFGGVLRSDLPIPTLRPSDGNGTPTWHFQLSPSPSPAMTGELLGEERLDASCLLQVWKTTGGLRFAYTDTGVFDIGEDGRRVVWYPSDDAPEDLAAIDLTGRVMAGALHVSGQLCLHGSAVAFDDGGIAFLAPKFHGKSTLATAMAEAGARFLTDDTLPVDLEEPVHMWPGVHSVRLWDDSARHLAKGRASSREARSGKHVLQHLPPDRLSDRRTTLSAVYVLSAHPPASGAPVARTLLPDVEAAMGIVQHTKIGGLLGKSEAPTLFNRAVAVARMVPVYRLDFVRDFSHLDAVVAQLLDWHCPPPSPGSAL